MVQLKCGNNKSNKEVSFWNGILVNIFSVISNLHLDCYLSYIENDGEKWKL